MDLFNTLPHSVIMCRDGEHTPSAWLDSIGWTDRGLLQSVADPFSVQALATVTTTPAIPDAATDSVADKEKRREE